MTKRKLKGYVKPTIFMISISIIVISLMVLNQDMETSNGINQGHVMNAIIDNVTPVVGTTKKAIVRPYTSDKISVGTSFYEKDASEEEQQKSLIYYENTYLQNSGIVYTCSEEFDVIAVLDGTVIDIKDDEILNKVIYIAHENNITTIYYGLKDVSININDHVSQSQVIGKSSNNKFSTEANSMLFEVNNNGQVMNPEEFYSININELN